VREDVTMTTDNTEDRQGEPEMPPGMKRPYVKPFVRDLDVEDSAGKQLFAFSESARTTGPS
jgi:hypothetical protein